MTREEPGPPLWDRHKFLFAESSPLVRRMVGKPLHDLSIQVTFAP